MLTRAWPVHTLVREMPLYLFRSQAVHLCFWFGAVVVCCLWVKTWIRFLLRLLRIISYFEFPQPRAGGPVVDEACSGVRPFTG